jgi:hypothetical protein
VKVGLCRSDYRLMHCTSDILGNSSHSADGGCSQEGNLISTEQPGTDWCVAPPRHLVAPDGALRSVQGKEELLNLCK